VDQFNSNVLTDNRRRYVARIKGKFLYLDRDDSGTTEQICRLEYTGVMNRWGFAIYKYSSGRYDPNESNQSLESTKDAGLLLKKYLSGLKLAAVAQLFIFLFFFLKRERSEKERA